jgi:hypothetical protein
MREVDISPPSIAKVKYEWSFTSTLPICLHGVRRETIICRFTFYTTHVSYLGEKVIDILLDFRRTILSVSIITSFQM